VPEATSSAPGRLFGAGLACLVVAGVLGHGTLQAAVVTTAAVSNGLAGLPTAPSGFMSALPGSPGGGGWADDLLDGFNLSTTVSATYDSNVTQSPGQAGTPALDDFILSVGGGLGYMSKSPEWTYGGNYQGSYNSYCNHPDFSGYSQSGGIVGNYAGGRLSSTMSLGVGRESGSNRYYGASNFIEQTRLNLGFSSRYLISPKTTLAGDFSESFTMASGGNFGNTNSFSMGASALWRYSPLTELGPGIRYSVNSSGGQNDRTTIGPTLSVNYKLSSKVSMNSRLGMDFASYAESGSSNPSLSAAVGLNYKASRLWGLNFSLFRDAQADPTLAGRYTEITSLRLGYLRQIRRATLNLGLGYETNRAVNSGTSAGGASPASDYWSFDGSLGMAVFSNTTMASIFVRYSDQSGSASDSFDAVTVGVSLSRSF
jgi:hypothetical protein